MHHIYQISSIVSSIVNSLFMDNKVFVNQHKSTIDFLIIC